LYFKISEPLEFPKFNINQGVNLIKIHLLQYSFVFFMKKGLKRTKLNQISFFNNAALYENKRI